MKVYLHFSDVSYPAKHITPNAPRAGQKRFSACSSVAAPQHKTKFAKQIQSFFLSLLPNGSKGTINYRQYRKNEVRAYQWWYVPL
jgi:hypothetical protein